LLSEFPEFSRQSVSIELSSSLNLQFSLSGIFNLSFPGFGSLTATFLPYDNLLFEEIFIF
jgi:hypothetical protein